MFFFIHDCNSDNIPKNQDFSSENIPLKIHDKYSEYLKKLFAEILKKIAKIFFKNSPLWLGKYICQIYDYSCEKNP